MTDAHLSSDQITRQSGSNFAASFRFLSKEKRKALSAIYAYCRMTDDIVDLNEGKETAPKVKAKLDEWRRQTMRALENARGAAKDAVHPVLQEVAKVAEKYKISPDFFQELVDGVQMDLEKKSYRTFDELYPYCYKVASVVGLACLEIFGYKNEKTKNFAVNLGVAFQLTNILRDVRTDAQRGRVYLPADNLQKFGLTPKDILATQSFSSLKTGTKNQLKGLLRLECRRAEHYYKKAQENLSPEDRPNMIAAEIMTAVYHAILKKIDRNPLKVFRTKVKVSKPELPFRVLQGFITNRFKL